MPEALAALKKRGKKVLFISNNASKHRYGNVQRFRGGLVFKAHRLFRSEAGSYLRLIDFPVPRRARI